MTPAGTGWVTLPRSVPPSQGGDTGSNPVGAARSLASPDPIGWTDWTGNTPPVDGDKGTDLQDHEHLTARLGHRGDARLFPQQCGGGPTTREP